MISAPRTIGKTLILLLIVGLFACVTINIYFPAEQVKKAAEQIVGDIRSQARPTPSGTQGDSSQSGALSIRPVVTVRLAVASAQQEISTSNATIRTIKSRIKARESQLAAYFNQGVIGEGRDGLVQILHPKSLSMKQRAAVQRLVKAENSDRAQLYREVAKALNVTGSEVPRIGKIFAEQWQKTSRKGWWIQKADGTWMQKP